MKKNLIILLLMFLCMLSFLGLAACGGGSENSKSPATSVSAVNPSATASAAAAQNQSSSSGLTWNDMPVYSGANEMQKGNWSLPASQGADYTKFEWRYYQTSASTADVAAFYKNKMPSLGWTEAGWMDMQDTSWGMYNKNNENDAAMVWVSTQDNQTVIAMWRGTK